MKKYLVAGVVLLLGVATVSGVATGAAKGLEYLGAPYIAVVIFGLLLAVPGGFGAALLTALAYDALDDDHLPPLPEEPAQEPLPVTSFRRLKIVYSPDANGPAGVYDAESGQLIKDIEAVSVSLLPGRMPRAYITVSRPEVQVEGMTLVSTTTKVIRKQPLETAVERRGE